MQYLNYDDRLCISTGEHKRVEIEVSSEQYGLQEVPA